MIGLIILVVQVIVLINRVRARMCKNMAKSRKAQPLAVLHGPPWLCRRVPLSPRLLVLVDSSDVLRESGSSFTFPAVLQLAITLIIGMMIQAVM